MCKIFVESFANRAMHPFNVRTFQDGFPTHLQLNAAHALYHVLKMFIKKFLALMDSYPYWCFPTSRIFIDILLLLTCSDDVKRLLLFFAPASLTEASAGPRRPTVWRSHNIIG